MGMTAPMVGAWEVLVHGVRPFTIHSDVYYELHVARTDVPEQVLSIKIPQHATDREPRPGEKLSLSFLMGQVTSVKRIEPAAGA